MLLIFFVIFAIVRTSNARFTSTATSETKLDVALYALSENNDLNIVLDTLVPRDAPYVYTFSVVNSDGTNITDAALVYDLKIIATTNIPLQYKLCMNKTESQCKSSGTANDININEVRPDEDGTFFRYMTTTRQEFGYEQEETNNYVLLVYFPSEYDSSEFQNLVESIQINVDSKQKLEGDG